MYAPPIRSSPTDGRIDSFSPSILSSSRNFFILGDFNCHHSFGIQEVLPTPAGRKYLTGSSLLISFPSMTLTHSSGSRSSSDISFAPSSFTHSCSWEVLQDLGLDHLSIPLSVPLSPAYRPHPSTVRKFAVMGLLPTLTPTVLLQRNTRLFPLLLLSLPLWH